MAVPALQFSMTSLTPTLTWSQKWPAVPQATLDCSFSQCPLMKSAGRGKVRVLPGWLRATLLNEGGQDEQEEEQQSQKQEPQDPVAQVAASPQTGPHAGGPAPTGNVFCTSWGSLLSAGQDARPSLAAEEPPFQLWEGSEAVEA